MIFENIAGVARPVRIAANSSLACSTALSIFSSASKRVSSITAKVASSAQMVLLRCGGSARKASGGDQGTDLLAAHGADDGVVTLGPEDQHGQIVLLAQAEGGLVGHSQALLQDAGEGDLLDLPRGRSGTRVGRLHAVHAVLAH